MTPQDKIQQLAMAALRSAPPPAGVPKPATFMAAPEKLKTAIPVANVVTPATAPADVVPVVAAMPVADEPPAKPFKDEADPELRAMIAARDEQQQQMLGRQSRLVTLAVLAVFCAAGTYVAVTPGARTQLAAVIPLFKQTAKDVQMVGSMKSQYDESLKNVTVRGEQIQDATLALGADPSAASAEDNAALEANMDTMMGGEGRSTMDRDRDIEQKFGAIQKLAGSDEK